MTITSLCWLAYNLFTTFAVVFALVRWWRAGRKFPRLVHRLAFALGVVGVLTASTLAFTDGLGWLVAACLLVPSLAVYVSWLWLAGPLLTEAGTDHIPRA